jgi:hypothetical protein
MHDKKFIKECAIDVALYGVVTLGVVVLGVMGLIMFINAQ